MVSGELKKILEEFNEKFGAFASAVVSRSGVPIAWNLPSGSSIENFAALSATMLGASEVIFTGLSKPPPSRIIVESPDGFLVVSSLGPKAFLVAVFQIQTAEVFRGMEELGHTILGVLSD